MTISLWSQLVISQPHAGSRQGSYLRNRRIAIFRFMILTRSCVGAQDDYIVCIYCLYLIYISFHKSCKSGLIFCISSSFQALFQFLICFSRSMASTMVSYSSTYMRYRHRYFVVNSEPLPCRCWAIRSFRFDVTPIYNTVRVLFDMTYT